MLVSRRQKSMQNYLSGRVTLITSKLFAINNCGNRTFMTNSVDPDQTAHVRRTLISAEPDQLLSNC